jgi:murein DD-endopeptidase MepM/ murein hydrolase activator NlpD
VAEAPEEGQNEEESRELEERLRREYEASLEAVTSELMQLYALESKARVITGLPPRAKDTEALVEEVGDGRGGPVDGLGAFSQFQVDAEMRPPQLIYGLTRPSADLLLQEIRLRTASLEAYVRDGNIQVDRLERVPSLRPVPSHLGRLTSRFGRRIDPINHRLSQHNGIDIAANRGTPIYASARGVVTSSGYENQLGNIVRIDHGNRIETWYAHMDALTVKVGQTVERGEQVGTVGTTGRTTGPHLHYEVHVNGVPVDGRKYIGD